MPGPFEVEFFSENRLFCGLNIHAYIVKYFQNVRELLVEYGGVGKDIISEIEEGELTRKNRMALVRIVVAYIIKNYGDRYVLGLRVNFKDKHMVVCPKLRNHYGCV